MCPYKLHATTTKCYANYLSVVALFLKADNRIINGCVIIGSSKLFIFVSVFHNCQRVIFSYKLKRNSRWTWIWLSISLSFFPTTIHMQKQKGDSHLEPLSSISSSFQLFSHSLVVRCDSIFHNDTNYFAFFLLVGWLFFFLSLSLAVLCALLFFFCCIVSFIVVTGGSKWLVISNGWEQICSMCSRHMNRASMYGVRCTVYVFISFRCYMDPYNMILNSQTTPPNNYDSHTYQC